MEIQLKKDRGYPFVVRGNFRNKVVVPGLIAFDPLNGYGQPIRVIDILHTILLPCII